MAAAGSLSASPTVGQSRAAERSYASPSTEQLDTPFDTTSLQDQPSPPHEIEVIDPAHPLCGRRFPLVSIHSTLHSTGYVLARYRQDILLRIPLPATDLSPPHLRTDLKLTSHALAELIRLAEQWEVLACQTDRKTSGAHSPRNSRRKSSRT
jgi:hypothetical protein